MSISPSSDIVLGVANAADPQRYRAALERLARSAAESAKVTGDVSAAPVKRDTMAAAAKDSGAANPASLPAGASGRPAASKSDKHAYEDFEAFFLQTFVEAMLPKDAQSLFGSGPAGKIWKSMLAEHLAVELARSTAFGIAEKIASSREDKKKAPAPTAIEQSTSGQSAQESAATYLTDLQKLLSVEGELAALNAKDGPQRVVGG